ncbi:MAG: response regulator [Variovorax sp.]|nr:MAG: response regulator [Variovorax sp.]
MKFVHAFSGIALVIGILALAGYVLDMPGLIALRPDHPGMSVITTLGVIGLALALVASSNGRRRIAASLAIAVALTAVAVLASHAASGTDRLSAHLAEHLFRLSGRAVPTSRTTAIALLGIAVSILFSRRSVIADLSAGVGVVLSTMALLGHAYGMHELSALVMFSSMALPTAAAVFMLAIASLVLRPDLGWSAVVASSYAAGGAARRQLGFMLVPPVVGWVLVQLVYLERLDVDAAMALFVVVTIIPMALMVLRDGRGQIALDDERKSRSEAMDAVIGQAQQQLVDQFGQLQAESAERARAEAAMYRAQRMEAVGHLTGGIAHDFNNLLMTISGNVQLLKRKMPTDDPLSKYLLNLSSAVTKGAKVTQQLLAFSRSQKLSIRPTAMESVLVNARDLIGHSLGPTVTLHLQLDASDAWALCDADQLELSLLNLVLNAKDAMPGGGVIDISCERSQMSATGASCVRIRVSDHGCGMTPDVLARAAEPFFTTKEKGNGTGLGLAQVYGFVTQCGGEFTIQSEVGSGTTIDMRFPSSAPVAERPVGERAVPVTPSGTARRRIVVIDDDAGVRDVIVQGLRDEGYLVSEAADGESGLQRIEDFSPALAVIDFLMPGLNGAEVARIAQARHPGLPIVFVSGYSDTLALDGVSGAIVLRKPFDIQALNRAVSAVIDPA